MMLSSYIEKINGLVHVIMNLLAGMPILMMY